MGTEMLTEMRSKMRTKILGQTRMGLPIFSHEFGDQGPEILIIGGVHGNEIEGVAAARFILARLIAETYEYQLRITIIPELNPEGVLMKTRSNSAGVDLNRNLPTKDWTPEFTEPKYNPGPSPGSEPENQVLMKILQSRKFAAIISLHSWKPMLNVNGDLEALAGKLSELTGYRIDKDIGYPTPGALGTYAGLERNWPTLTYEIERGLSLDKVVAVHGNAVLQAIRVYEGK